MSNGVWEVLQIAPNDHPPFGDILSVYQSALGRLGVRVQTLVLSPATGAPVAGATYLDLDDLGNIRAGAAAIRAAVSGAPVLALCHRYRTYRLLRASRLRVPEVVTIAHEFGFFKRLQRRLETVRERWLNASQSLYLATGKTSTKILDRDWTRDADRLHASMNRTASRAATAATSAAEAVQRRIREFGNPD